MRRFGLGLLVVTVIGACALFGAACSSSDEIDAADYSSACAKDDDCVAVSFGDVCATACTPNGAIQRSEESRYRSDFAEKSEDCPVTYYTRAPCADVRTTTVTRCTASRCTVEQVPVADAGADG